MKPITTQLTDRLETLLKTVKISGGYRVNLNVTRITARLLRDTDFGEGTTIILPEDPTRIDATGDGPDWSHPLVQWMQPYSVYTYINPEDRDTQPIDEQLDLYRAEIERAIFSDQLLSVGSSPMALRMTLGDPAYDYGFSPLPSVVTAVTYHMRTKRGDPFNLS